ncbi:unnamed protein product [Hermetia illucens]|uniref:Uncharacterized protein n=1 Tax=Hermetia illucens TaxID=343691 RepID=A0A7R8YRU7_HERIL|nr:uncharacterized protein LOC119649856 isoform X3 [Hermetia illucens]CAD7083241.1 unnamed protein product [Hermetia illucens]
MQTISDSSKGFIHLQFIIRFAGVIGMLQSLGWLGLSIMGITAHYCAFDKVNSEDQSVAAITQQTFYHMYFGTCGSSSKIDFNSLDKIALRLDYQQVNTWVWVYFAIHILWFCSSASLMRKVATNRLVLLNTILLIWVLITLAISAMDLGLGVLFGLDYGEILAVARTALYFDDSPEVASVLLAGMTSSISMMIIALRGFVLWVINVALLSYFFVQTFIISKAPTNVYGHDNEGFVSETQSDILRQPIDAYAPTNKEPDRNSGSVQLNVEPLKRANAMSVDSLLQRHYQRYPPDPDYSPQMVRSDTAATNQSNRPLKSALRNSRFQ